MSRIIAALLFAALIVSGIRLSYFRPPHPDPAPNGVSRQPLRFRSDPTAIELRQFFDAIRARTKHGERIALVFAPPHDDFSYAYWRASYALAGRRVMRPPAFVDIGPADAVAIWQTELDDSRFEVVWRGGGGALARRRPE